MNIDTPAGFRPRSSVKPLWLHTIELDPDQNLVGVVVCAAMRHLNDIADLIEVPTGPDRLDLIVHQTAEEVWLRLTRGQAVALRSKLGKFDEATSPFGDYAYPAYDALVEVENIISHQDEY